MKLGACWLLLVATLFSQTKPEDLCTVEGQVLNLATGAPVRKAEIVLRGTDQPSSVFSIESDAGGRRSKCCKACCRPWTK
jgi:hypothetical protein